MLVKSTTCNKIIQRKNILIKKILFWKWLKCNFNKSYFANVPKESHALRPPMAHTETCQVIVTMS